MKIEERSYGGKLFRPRPEVFQSSDESLFVIATPWGSPEAAKSFISSLTQQFAESLEDLDKTMAQTQVDFLSFEANRLRMAIISAHEDIREKYNDESLQSGVEFVCFLKTEHQISWFAVGGPFVGLKRKGHLQVLRHPVDLSFDHSKEQPLPPLPKELLGLQSHIGLEHGSFRHQKSDELLLVHRSYVPHEVFSLPFQDLEIEALTLTLAKESEQQPFWMGLLKF